MLKQLDSSETYESLWKPRNPGKMPRLFTQPAVWTKLLATYVASCGIRYDVADGSLHTTASQVLSVLSWSRLLHIHNATSSTDADIFSGRMAATDG